MPKDSQPMHPVRSVGRAGLRGLLGAGLVDMPSVPYHDPMRAILANPQVAEEDRFCSDCGKPVGRGAGPGEPGPTQGCCPACGARFSFTPKLTPGRLVAGQYEVLGCLAYGGLGWIHLAIDRNVSDRYVVLKGLIHDSSPAAVAAVAAESAFLAEVEHPSIVKIHNFVHDDEDGESSGYIVMEYIGGQSLAALLRERGTPPLGQAISYALEVLPALAYLHGRALVYCDLKPDNVIQSEEQLRLIDLGGVRHLDDTSGMIYGSAAYQAPEVATLGPSIASDLYTVGRMLAVLSFPFDHDGAYLTSLPAREDVPLLSRFESYDRFLRRATHPDRSKRFQDAGEMADQLLGVLREVLAAEDGVPRPAPSTRFGPERYAAGTSIAAPDGGGPALRSVAPATAAAALPVPLVDVTSPAAGFLAGLSGLEPDKMITALVNARASTPQASGEIGLVLARVRTEEGDFLRAGMLLDEIAAAAPGDWRTDWLRAVALLTAGRITEAQELFDELWSKMPGEAAPKLALAFCLEYHGELAEAAALYETVWRTDNSYLNAAFGLARVRLAAGDLAVAVAALDSVPKISSEHVAAQVAAVASAVRDRIPAELTDTDLAGVGGRLTRLKLDGLRHEQLAVEVMEAALAWVLAGNRAPKGATLLGAPLTERGLRTQLERGYRELARHARSTEDRRALVRRANHVRPRTFL
jgi:serine/threonine-protein kinase PknG